MSPASTVRALIDSMPEDPAAVLEWVAARFADEGWSHPSPEQPYLRALDDQGWKARMLGLQRLVRSGEAAVEPLIGALGSEQADLRVFAAQTLGFLAQHTPVEPLIAALESDPRPSVRLYAADAIGMRGSASEHAELLERRASLETDRDVRMHIGYALERNDAALDPAVIDALLAWDPLRLDSARVGEPAPDFELDGFDGERVRLANFVGKGPVVLVFLYGDT